MATTNRKGRQTRFLENGCNSDTTSVLHTSAESLSRRHCRESAVVGDAVVKSMIIMMVVVGEAICTGAPN